MIRASLAEVTSNLVKSPVLPPSCISKLEHVANETKPIPAEMVPVRESCRAVIDTAALPLETKYPVPTMKDPAPLQSLSATTVSAFPVVVAADDVDNATSFVEVKVIAPFDVIYDAIVISPPVAVIEHELLDVVLSLNETDVADTVILPPLDWTAAVADNAPDVELAARLVPAVTTADSVIPEFPVKDMADPDDIAAETVIVGATTVRAFLKLVAPENVADEDASMEQRDSVKAVRSRAPIVAAEIRVDPSCNVPDVVIVASSLSLKMPPEPNEKAPETLRSKRTFAELADKIKPVEICTSAPDNETAAMAGLATVMLAVEAKIRAPAPLPALSALIANVDEAPVTRTGAESCTWDLADHVAAPDNQILPGDTV